jgi:WD40 repeat protein
MNSKIIIIVITLLLLIQTSCEPNIQIPTSIKPTDIAPPAEIPLEQTPLQITWLHRWSMPVVGDMQWSADSAKFVVAFPYSSNSMRMYDAATFRLLWYAPISRSSSTMVFDAGENYIYSGLSTLDGGVLQRDMKTGKLIQEPVNFKPENTEDGKCVYEDAIDVVISKDGTKLFFLIRDNHDKNTSYAEIQVWNTASLQCEEILLRIEGHAHSLTSSPDGDLLIIGISEGHPPSPSGKFADKGHTIIWDVKGNAFKCMIPGVNGVFMPHSDQLIVFESGADEKNDWMNRLVLWDAQKCEFVREISEITPPYYYLSPMSITSDGQYLAIGQNEIKILDIATGELVAEIEYSYPHPSDTVSPDILSFSPNGKLLFFSTEGGLKESLVNLWAIERIK